jgi:AcrR family transcriptional regulator
MTKEECMAVTTAREDARLMVSRNAAKLFIERGVAGTSGDDIAAASGLSTRTVWRYFRSKESCVEPLFTVTSLRFTALLREWPFDTSIETYLHAAFRPSEQASSQEIADGVAAVRLIALMADEPALRTAWLMSCHKAEEGLVEVVRKRCGPSASEFDVRLCAATIMAAVRVVDEDISIAAIKFSQRFTETQTNATLAKAIRAACTLPICDPVA